MLDSNSRIDLECVSYRSSPRPVPKKRRKSLLNGADHVIIDYGNIGEQVLKQTGEGVDHCFELVGSHKSLKDRAAALKPHGKLCLVGILGPALPRLPLLPLLVPSNMVNEFSFF